MLSQDEDRELRALERFRWETRRFLLFAVGAFMLALIAGFING